MEYQLFWYLLRRRSRLVMVLPPHNSAMQQLKLARAASFPLARDAAAICVVKRQA